MSNPVSKLNPKAEEQAALWAARIEGSELTVENRRELDRWLAENPTHRALLSDYCQLSADLELQIPALVAAGAFTNELAATAEKPRPSNRIAWFFGGAIAAAAALVFTFWIAKPKTPREIATLAGQRQSITLPDGSHIDLNANTRLRIENRRDERHVVLSSGEAYFMVAKDKAHPFIVETSAGSVRVTGTMFDVQAPQSDQLTVTVTEGSVQVRVAAKVDVEPAMLHPGDQLAAVGAKVMRAVLSKSALADVTAWREGQIVFDSVPLSEALSKFASYHGRVITASAGAAELKLGGRFNLDDLDGFLTALEEVLPVKVTHEASGAVRVALRNEH
ncbi:MAG TPA: FecR domain-containing protein [Opitutaceae bacterium]